MALFISPEQTLLPCYSRQKKKKRKIEERKQKSLLRAAVSGESVLLFYVFSSIMLPTPRREQIEEGADQEASARCRSYLKCPTALVRTSERMM